MQETIWFFLTIAAAAAGGFILYKLKFPAGALVGSMLGVIALSLTTESAVFYRDLKPILQVFSGAMIGSRIGKKDIKEIKHLLVPILILVLSMFIMNITFSLFIVLLTPLDVPTALFATSPGGVSDMALIASDFGANVSYVAVLQLCRLLIIFIFMPPIFRKIGAKRQASLNTRQTENKPEAETKPAPKPKASAKDFIFLVLSAAAGGAAFYYMGITAGALIGGMIFSALYSIIRGKAVFPKNGKTVLQIFSGAFIGIQIDRASIYSMKDLVIPIIIMTAGIFIFVFGIAYLMSRASKIDLLTCMLASTPGGLQEMSLLSEELAADTPKIAIMQTVRLFSVVSFFPSINIFITSLLV